MRPYGIGYTRAVHRSQALQMIHYLARRHRGRPRGPVGGAAAFRAESVRKQGDFHTVLSPAVADEIVDAVGRACTDRTPLRSIRRGTVRFGRFDAVLDDARHELAFGRGFVVLRGLPIERLGERQRECLFAAIGHRLGIPGAQNPEGELLGHVRDEGGRTADTRLYRTNAPIAFHCDAADVVGLLCLSTAATGGESRIASSVAVHDRLLVTEPTLAAELYRPFMLDTRAEGGLRHFPVIPSRFDGTRLRTFYHSDYFRSVERHGPALRLRDEQRALLDAFDAIAGSPEFCLEMQLEPGDVQLLSNHTVVHGRGGYQDSATPRHLLRLWLSLPGAYGAGGALLPTLGLVADIGRHLVAGPR